MRYRWIALALVLLALVGAGTFALRARPVEMHGTLLDPPLPARDFELTSAAGPVRLSDLRGKIVVVFFGYTFCPDVCPTTMVRLGNAIRQLGGKADDVRVVMVSVDPERDTPERLAEYVGAFHPSFLGLTGTPEQIAEVASAYGIYHAKAEGSAASGYLVDHTATVTVLDRDGRVRLLWPFEVDADAMAADLRALL